MRETEHTLPARRRPARAARTLRTLLLPGLGGSTAVWAPFLALAPRNLDVRQADVPWTGGGDGRWSHHPDPVRWVVRAARRAGAPVDLLIAHSFAATLALDLPGRAAGVRPAAFILVSPFYRPAASDFDWATMAYYLEGFHRILDEGLRIGGVRPSSAELRGPMALRVRERIGPYGWMRFFDAYLRTPFQDVSAIRVPTLVVTGEHDIAARPDDARALAAALPAGRLEVLEGCGHFAMAERPDRFAQIVDDFLRIALPAHRTDPESP